MGARGGEYFEQIFEAVPSPMLVVDADVRIQAFNPAAEAMLGAVPDSKLSLRAGEALCCSNADKSPEGCGRSAECRACVIRSSVSRAIVGRRVEREPALFVVKTSEGEKQVHLLVTAAPFTAGNQRHVILIFEDRGPLRQLQALLPLCPSCHQRRSGETYWASVAQFVGDKGGAQLPHSICEECSAKQHG